ncbi:MAG: AMP-binding protein [Pyrinomonadaceae bacterium]|nr:AMP-binding protein [Pyrinomonadaceae bacterium]
MIQLELVAESANLAVNAVARHAVDRSKLALVWESLSGTRQSFTFFDIERLSNRIANVLTDLDTGKGDRIFVLLNRTPELYSIIPAILKVGAAVGVLFTDFGREAIRQRLEDSGARIVITDGANVHKIKAICENLPSLEHILVVGETGEKVVAKVQIHDFHQLVNVAKPDFTVIEVSPDDNCFLIYTSGTTGLPKGVVHRHAISERLMATARDVLQLENTDFYWCTADVGWVTGLCYGIFAPWLLGLPFLIYEGEFDSQRWLDVLEKHQVTCWYITPTLLRLMRNEIGDITRKRDFALDRIYSVGEPLNPEVISWATRIFDAPVFDNYWQTETGSHIIANRPNIRVLRGSMGKAVDGVEVAIIDNSGREVANNIVGDIAIYPSLSSMFKGYWNFPEATRACFRNGWYITKDRGRRDDDGYFWFVARNDDVITCEAQRIGPFEVENALLSHPSIAESAAIGVSDALTTEHVKAFIVLRKEFEPSLQLALEIANHVKSQLSPLATPREIEFCDSLPTTRSGKIQRDVLRRQGEIDGARVFVIG